MTVSRFLCTFPLMTGTLAILAAQPPPSDFEPLPTSAADVAQGEKLFRNYCGLCHGPKGEGSRGPTLARAKLRRAPNDATLVSVIKDGIRGTEMPAADDVMTEREIRQTAAYVRSLGRIETAPVPGEPALGSAVYRGKGNCSSCHSVRGDGGAAGPDLAGIGDRRSSAYLLRSLVEPEADLPDGYLLVAITPRSGTRVSGIRVNEDSFSIQVRDASGAQLSFWKSDLLKIDKMRGKSAMPSYRNQLSQSELTNLVAYLVSLKEEK